ncbi:hypothetical protein Hamer_G026981 [Homarus americanus]|uniref:Uncharacterized protein n=1 Tax=Homarus americanus TaxID=6706 RepID=A0A8J5MUI6_HOMAM|nr:hypothetical protein Hamer_G026932 [Homarus americanus]KAG7177491.1 hypothetical protein Hamer_G026981 [Homarus americanus]
MWAPNIVSWRKTQTGENLLRSNWSSSQLAYKPRQFHWTIIVVAMIIGDLSRNLHEYRPQ